MVYIKKKQESVNLILFISANIGLASGNASFFPSVIN